MSNRLHWVGQASATVSVATVPVPDPNPIKNPAIAIEYSCHDIRRMLTAVNVYEDDGGFTVVPR